MAVEAAAAAREGEAMAEEHIDAIKKRLEAAPPWPWKLVTRVTYHAIFDASCKLIDSIPEADEGRTPELALAELIASAPADLSYLLGELEALRGENERLRAGESRKLEPSKADVKAEVKLAASLDREKRLREALEATDDLMWAWAKRGPSGQAPTADYAKAHVDDPDWRPVSVRERVRLNAALLEATRG